jgi:cytidylate kinase
MRLLAIDREYGCGGAWVAQQLADRLGWKLWDTAIVYEAALRAGVPVSVARNHDEQLDSRRYRWIKMFCRGFFDESSLRCAELFDSDAMAALYRKIVSSLAKAGNHVIVGRGAAYLLRNHTEVFRVYLYASTGEKIGRLTADGMRTEDAAALLDCRARQQQAFLRHYFGKLSNHAYDLMVNTGTSWHSVVDTILVSMQKKAMGQRAGVRLQETGLRPAAQNTAVSAGADF